MPRASPDQGEDGHPTYRVPLEKPRRGPGRYHETRNVTDDGAGSPGRLITQALQATRFARAIVEELAPGTDRLVVVAVRERQGPAAGGPGPPTPRPARSASASAADAASRLGAGRGTGRQPVPAGARAR